LTKPLDFQEPVSDYISAFDVFEKDPILTIKEVRVEDGKFQQGQTKRVKVLVFEGTQKRLVLQESGGKTSAKYKECRFLLGRDESKWVGRKIQLYTVKTTWKGNPTYGVRIRIPR
jgi:hypothetical protein